MAAKVEVKVVMEAEPLLAEAPQEEKKKKKKKKEEEEACPLHCYCYCCEGEGRRSADGKSTHLHHTLVPLRQGRQTLKKRMTLPRRLTGIQEEGVGRSWQRVFF